MTELELRENLYPEDGYRAVVADNRPVALAVYAEAFAKGRSAAPLAGLAPVLVYEARANDDRAFGEASRAQHLVDALGRFLNTGGTREELADVVRRVAPLLQAPLRLPAGYYLLETYLNTDGVHEHVFVSDEQDEAVVWVEGSFVDLVPWDTVMERMVENGRLQSAAFVEHALLLRAAAAAEGAADLPGLPDRQDPPGA